MKFVKQPQSFQINTICNDFSKNGFRHGELLPDSVRCIICGPSNCGKTNLLIGLLIHENGLKFQNIYVYSKTMYQPKYMFLEKVLQLVPNISLHKYQGSEEVLKVQDAKPNSIIIFDDVACENQNNMRDYFAMGRHKYIDCFYLNQTYSKIPKQLIRDNANLIIVFKQDEINLKHIYEEHVNTDMSWLEFREMCTKIWNRPFDYVVINKDCSKNNGGYRNKLDTFVVFDQ